MLLPVYLDLNGDERGPRDITEYLTCMTPLEIDPLNSIIQLIRRCNRHSLTLDDILGNPLEDEMVLLRLTNQNRDLKCLELHPQIPYHDGDVLSFMAFPSSKINIYRREIPLFYSAKNSNIIPLF